MSDHETYMAKAIQLSKESAVSGGGPFGTVIVKDGLIVGEGKNRVTLWNDPTAHGEIVAIREACRHLKSHQLEGCTLYTSCEPCPMCLGAIYWARPRTVYFANTKTDAAAIGFDDAFIYAELEREHAARSIPFVQLMRNEALEAFRLWSENTDKKHY